MKFDKYDRYESEYKLFVQTRTKPKYYSESDIRIYVSEIASLRCYKNLGKKQNSFLIIPSIFNSPEILFLSEQSSIIHTLVEEGDVYLIEWSEVRKQLFMEDLVVEVSNIIKFLQENDCGKINLIGHCLGGNIAIAIASNEDHRNILKSLTLLTTPWDFSYLYKFAILNSNLKVFDEINEIDNIPKAYIQIMFFLMFPIGVENKLNKYFSMPVENREMFLHVEDWLHSGIAIPRSLYKEIIHDFCLKNNTMNNKWLVRKRSVELKNIVIPTCIIYAASDQIVPYTSILPLQKEIKDSNLIELKGGHISYLIDPDKNFQKKYKNWLNIIL